MTDELNDPTALEGNAGSLEPGLAREEGYALWPLPNTRKEEGSVRPANEISDSGSEDAEDEGDVDEDEGEDDDEEELDDDEDLPTDDEEDEDEA